MTSITSQPHAAAGTALAPEYRDGPAETHDDVQLHSRYYTYEADAERVAGVVINIMFTLHLPVKDVWPYFKDSNLWHNAGGYYYSGVLGDLEGKTFRLSTKPDDPGPHQYNVVKVIPEHLIVWHQPGPWDGGSKPYDGYGVYTLNEHDGRTIVAIVMEHASRTKNQTTKEALEVWQPAVAAGHRIWREHFIPTLKKLVYGSSQAHPGR